MARIRLLDRLCELHPESDREELLALVLCGDVSVEGERLRDPRGMVARDARISLATVAHGARRYVGRGGLKLEHAIREWRLPVSGKVFVDAGASTGGFTDCLLAHGVRHVHAVDVGYNQLDFRLRRDERVETHERTNIMHVSLLEPPADAAVADLSFRSIRGAARHLLELAREQWAVVLVKPQFEWTSPPESFDGTVPDTALGLILRSTLEGLAEEGAFPAALLESPIRGRRGNREFLVLIRFEASRVTIDRLVAEVTS
ncbi:MAG: TlyA family RNA methyltransferase [Spirochaetota bacterium]